MVSLGTEPKTRQNRSLTFDSSKGPLSNPPFSPSLIKFAQTNFAASIKKAKTPRKMVQGIAAFKEEKKSYSVKATLDSMEKGREEDEEGEDEEDNRKRRSKNLTRYAKRRA